MKIILSNQWLDSIDMNAMENVPPYNQQYFPMASGQEHYRLLVHLGYCFNGVTIADLGTNRGASALALGQNKSNKIYTLDIENILENDIKMDNVEFEIGNFMENEEIQKKILSSEMILLDLNHEYVYEIWIYDFLVRNNWKGMMVCDDIHYFEGMRRFWSEVSHKKVDLSKYGHSAGTGCILFGDDIEFEML